MTSTPERLLEEFEHARPWVSLDPSHLLYKVTLHIFARVWRSPHVHMKGRCCETRRAQRHPQLTSSLGITEGWISVTRAWDVDLEEIIRALNDIGYTGPLSVEWKTAAWIVNSSGRGTGVRPQDRPTPSQIAFDGAMKK